MAGLKALLHDSARSQAGQPTRNFDTHTTAERNSYEDDACTRHTRDIHKRGHSRKGHERRHGRREMPRQGRRVLAVRQKS